MNELSALSAESTVSALSALYDRYGYSRYKMNKFEEYDLYARNKDFLISDGVITFTDTNGKLMALKPDVTLSIVKNTKDEGTVRKLYYNENVYRISRGTSSFREIMQIGLEAIGDIDTYTIFEVLSLAADSLALTGRSHILEISHLGLLSSALDHAGIGEEDKGTVLGFIGEKNRHELAAFCREKGVSEEATAYLTKLASIYGTPEKVLLEITELFDGVADKALLDEFTSVIGALASRAGNDALRIDFSVVNDIRYYNGFVFKGFLEGIPDGVLSGGQYDTLMKKMGRESGAVGFAVYLDLIGDASGDFAGYDADVLLLYSDGCSVAEIGAAVRKLTVGGESVLALKEASADVRCRRTVTLKAGETL